MCGICGIVNLDGRSADQQDLAAMVAAQRHRGPDGHGVWSDGHVGLGHARLSIIDVEGGHQPLANETESIWVTFNGEIYNYRALREQLGDRHEFRTRSDTEVLVHLYEEHGERFVEHLHGFFALALWDGDRRRLILARDRLGKKPLFFARSEGRFLFASEIRSLLAVWGERPAVDPLAIDDVLAVRYARGGRTGFRDIHRLLPGELLVLEGDRMERRRYWRPPTPEARELGVGEAVEEFRERLDRAVSARLESEVPLGLLLSGGIDSTAVLESASRVAPHQLKTFTVAFSREKESEAEFASATARHFGADHRQFDLGEKDLLDHVQEILPHMDEPFADPSFLPTALVCKLAKTEVTVCLTGDGGDEMFGGYNRYAQTLADGNGKATTAFRRAFYEWALPRMPHYRMKGWKIARNLRSALGSPEERYTARLISVDAEIRSTLLGPRFEEDYETASIERETARALGSSGPLAERMMAHDREHYLPGLILRKVDRASMKYAVETRSPFLDVDLLEWAAGLPTDLKLNGVERKILVRAALRGRVPDSILDRPKRGFGTPLGRWFRHELAPYVDELLLDSRLAADGYLRQDAIGELVRAHRAKWRNLGEALWSLLALETWYRQWVLREGVSLGS